MRTRTKEATMESQFFSCVPMRDLELPKTVTGLSRDEQRDLIHKLFERDLYHNFPPPHSYQLSFLKWIMSQVEIEGYEVCEELYELYGSLVSQPQPTDHPPHCYKSYFIEKDVYITLKESNSIISSGTTGLTTWQAACYFLEWAVENLDNFSQKEVLELGSGVGLVGLTLCRVATPPSSYCFTDCHQDVLSLLHHNLDINAPADGGWSSKISVKELDWTSDSDTILSTFSHPIDCIIATDVVYDETVIESFVNTLSILLSHWPRAVVYVTSTIRSENTYKYFISKLDEKQVPRNLIASKASTPLFHYDRTQPCELIKLNPL